MSVMKPRIGLRGAPMPRWRPEIHFLLDRLGATGVRTDPPSGIHASPGRLSWDYLLATASAHGVLPLLYRSVPTPGTASIPAGVMQRMRREYGAIAQRNFVFAQELLRLVACLHDHDIVVVPYKGAPLAAAVYGDLSLRQFSDLDILVKPDDVVRAKQLLEEQGYQARFIYGRRPLSKLTAAETAKFIEHFHEYEMQRNDGLLIDLHWQLAPRHYPFRIDPAPLWNRLVTVDVEGRPIPGFADEDLLLVLCMHGAKDLWKKLIWIIDLDRLLGSNRALDWDSIFCRAQGARMELPLLLGLQLVSDLFAPNIPCQVETELRAHDAIPNLARETVAGLFEEPARPARFPVKSLHLKLCRNFGDRLSYAAQALCVPRVGDWALVRLPARLYPLYYVVRPLYVLALWAWSSIRSRANRGKRALFARRF